MPDPSTELRLRPLLEAASDVLRPLNCDVLPRSFDPPTLPALYLVSRQSIQAEEMRAAREAANGLWADVLSTMSTTSTRDTVSGAGAGDGEAERPQLVLNLRSPVVRRMIELPDPHLAGLAVQALYGQALLQGHHPLRPQDSALLNQSFLGLLDWAMRPGSA
jgi:molecular chaperone HtpG